MRNWPSRPTLPRVPSKPETAHPAQGPVRAPWLSRQCSPANIGCRERDLVTGEKDVAAFIETLGTAQWRETTDRDGNRAYCLPTGQVVCKDRDGRRCVSVYYTGYINAIHTGDRHGAGFGTTTTIHEAKQWAEADAFTP